MVSHDMVHLGYDLHAQLRFREKHTSGANIGSLNWLTAMPSFS